MKAAADTFGKQPLEDEVRYKVVEIVCSDVRKIYHLGQETCSVLANYLQENETCK